LYVHDIHLGEDWRIGSELVQHAVWSPDGRNIAYLTLGSPAEVKLIVHRLSSQQQHEIASGMLAPDSIEWTDEGDTLLYRIRRPLTTDFFHDQQYSSEVRAYNIARNTVVSAEAAKSHDSMYVTRVREGVPIIRP
jgi:hypothetical protein